MLLSERSLESDRPNRALPVSGLIRTVAIRSKARPNPDQGGWAFAARVETGLAKIGSSDPVEPGIDPLHLFGCGLSWSRYSNTTAGWELVRCLRSSGQAAQIAAALLAHVDKKPSRTPVRAIDDPGKPSHQCAAGLLAPARWRP